MVIYYILYIFIYIYIYIYIHDVKGIYIYIKYDTNVL